MQKESSPSALRQQITKIIEIVTGPDSRPRAIMEANKMNTAPAWDEEADATGFDAHVTVVVESYDQAVDTLVARGLKLRSP